MQMNIYSTLSNTFVTTLRFALLALSVLFYGYPAQADQHQTAVILVMGDSLSAAYGMDPQQGWVHLLGERLKQKGLEYRVVNASITGDTTRGGLARLPQALEKHQPSVIIIELGANDGLRGFNPKQIQYNLQSMVQLGQRHHARVLLVGVRIPSNYGKAYTQRFEAVFPSVAEATGIPLVPYILDGVVERPELFQRDRIHPTAEAQIIMLDNIWPQLEAMLRP
jgi:acyl-CoA thioesterase-1